ncbi:MAG TPA: hypothetical protein VLI04_10570 [Nocardioidaceae bacterium]|nr:hypothetical protein [Nocardioidaceae bacterium]
MALAPVVVFMAMAHTTIEGESAAEMTPSQVTDRFLPWVLVALFWALPVALAALAFVRIDRRRPVRLAAGAGIVLLAGYVVAQAGIAAIDSATLGDSQLFAFAILLSLLGWWSVDLAAILTCAGLHRSGIVTRTALVVGILTALLVVVEVAVYLPALVGEATLHDTIGLPPMALPILWAVLGGALWRKGAPVRV